MFRTFKKILFYLVSIFIVIFIFVLASVDSYAIYVPSILPKKGMDFDSWRVVVDELISNDGVYFFSTLDHEAKRDGSISQKQYVIVSADDLHSVVSPKSLDNKVTMPLKFTFNGAFSFSVHNFWRDNNNPADPKFYYHSSSTSSGLKNSGNKVTLTTDKGKFVESNFNVYNNNDEVIYKKENNNPLSDIFITRPKNMFSGDKPDGLEVKYKYDLPKGKYDISYISSGMKVIKNLDYEEFTDDPTRSKVSASTLFDWDYGMNSLQVVATNTVTKKKHISDVMHYERIEGYIDDDAYYDDGYDFESDGNNYTNIFSSFFKMFTDFFRFIKFAFSIENLKTIFVPSGEIYNNNFISFKSKLENKLNYTSHLNNFKSIILGSNSQWVDGIDGNSIYMTFTEGKHIKINGVSYPAVDFSSILTIMPLVQPWISGFFITLVSMYNLNNIYILIAGRSFIKNSDNEGDSL